MAESPQDGQEVDVRCTPEDIYSTFIEAKLSCSFRVLGSQLGLDPPDLDEIELYPPNERLMNLLTKCSQRRGSDLTWTWVVDVLKKPALKQKRVVEFIERHQHAHRSSSVSSSVSLSSSTSSEALWTPTPMETGRAV